MNNPSLITDYNVRQLTPEEVKLVEEIVALGPQLDSLIVRIRQHIVDQVAAASMRSDGNAFNELDRINKAEPLLWLTMGKQRLQEGLIGLTRAVSQPDFF